MSAADQAVDRLLAAGFAKDQITVVCSDEAKEKHFRQFEHQDPAGSHAPGAVAAGVSIGAAAGGLTAIAMGAATGAVPLVIAGAAGMLMGGRLALGKDHGDSFGESVQRLGREVERYSGHRRSSSS